jgi:PKD repeat protein
VAISILEPSTATYRLNGELNEETENKVFNLDGHKVELEDVIQTNADDNSGIVQVAFWQDEDVPVLCDDCDTPTDIDSDGLYEDTDGDGEMTIDDATVLSESDALSNETSYYVNYFDYNDNAIVGFGDVTYLSNLANDSRPARLCAECDAPTDVDADDLYEDVNGDGEARPGDATVLFNAVWSTSLSPVGSPRSLVDPERRPGIYRHQIYRGWTESQYQ